MNQTKDLKEFIKYAALNVMGMTGLSCYILADTFFISKGLGANGLTALNLAIPVYSLIHGSGLMLGMGGATKYSILKSQKNWGQTNKIFTNTVYLAGILAIAFLLTGIFLTRVLTAFLGADQEVFGMTATYLRVILLFAPAFLMNDILICFVRNDGDPKLAMLAMLGGSLSNVLLDYLFIFPLKLGIFGAVFATGLAPLISIMILSVYFLKKRNQFHLIREKLHPETEKTIVKLGIPSLIGEVSSGVVILVFNSIILKLQGNTGVAAYGVIANLSLVVMAVYTGIAQGMQPLISKAWGRCEIRTCKRILSYAMITMAAVSIVVYAVIFFLADPIAGIFNSENNRLLQEIAVTGLKLYFTAAVFAGFNLIISIYFTSVELALPAQLISILRGVVLIVPMAFLLSGLFGMSGVWLAFPAAELLTAVTGFFLYCSKRKQYR